MRRTISLLTLLFATNFLTAAEPPTVELRIQSVKQLVTYLPYLGELVGQGEQAENAVNFIDAFGGKKGVIEGVDLNKPIGFYASLTPAMIDSPLVLMMPVADKAAVLKLMKEKLNLKPEEGDDGVYSFSVPQVPTPLFFSFHEGYLCLTALNKENVLPKKLLNPKDFFAKDLKSAASLTLNLDRLPNEVKKQVLGQMELKFADEKGKPAKSEGERKLRELILDAIFGGVKMLFNDGRAANLDLTIEPKTDDIALNFQLGAKSNSELQTILVDSAKRKSVASQAATAKHPMLSLSVNASVPESMLKRYREVVDLAMGEVLENAKAGDRDGMKMLLDALEPTLKSGILQFGAKYVGPTSKPTLTAALRMVEGKKIESFAKEVAKFVAEFQQAITFDVEKLEKANLHKLALPLPEFEKIFKNDLVWLATGDDLIVVGVDDLNASTKQLANASAVVAPILHFEAGAAGLAFYLEKNVRGDQLKKLISETFGDDPSGKDTVGVSVTAGETLKANVSIKGKAVQFLVAIDKKKKGS